MLNFTVIALDTKETIAEGDEHPEVVANRVSNLILNTEGEHPYEVVLDCGTEGEVTVKPDGNGGINWSIWDGLGESHGNDDFEDAADRIWRFIRGVYARELAAAA